MANYSLPTNEIEALLPLFALGGLSLAETRQVEQYLLQHPQKQDEVNELMAAASLLAQSVPEITPPSHVKTAVLDHIKHARAVGRSQATAPKVIANNRPQKRRRSWFSGGGFSWRPILALASVGLMALLAFTTVQTFTLRGQIRQIQSQNEGLTNSLVRQGWLISYLLDENVERFAIAGTEASPAANGQFILRENETEGILIINDLSHLTADQTYQFWVIDSDTEQALSAGLFDIGEDGIGVLKVELDAALSQFEAIGVSIEPAGGSDSPSDQIVMLAELP